MAPSAVGARRMITLKPYTGSDGWARRMSSRTVNRPRAVAASTACTREATRPPYASMSVDTINASNPSQSCARSQPATAAASPGVVNRPRSPAGGATTSACAMGAIICGYCRQTGLSSSGTSAMRSRFGITGAVVVDCARAVAGHTATRAHSASSAATGDRGGIRADCTTGGLGPWAFGVPPSVPVTAVPRSPLPAPRSPFPAPRSPLPVPRSPFPAPRSPLPVPRSPLPVPRSPFPVPRSPFPVPRSRS